MFAIQCETYIYTQVVHIHNFLRHNIKKQYCTSRKKCLYMTFSIILLKNYLASTVKIVCNVFMILDQYRRLFIPVNAWNIMTKTL